MPKLEIFKPKSENINPNFNTIMEKESTLISLTIKFILFFPNIYIFSTFLKKGKRKTSQLDPKESKPDPKSILSGNIYNQLDPQRKNQPELGRSGSVKIVLNAVQ